MKHATNEAYSVLDLQDIQFDLELRHAELKAELRLQIDKEHRLDYEEEQ